MFTLFLIALLLVSKCLKTRVSWIWSLSENINWDLFLWIQTSCLWRWWISIMRSPLLTPPLLLFPSLSHTPLVFSQWRLLLSQHCCSLFTKTSIFIWKYSWHQMQGHSLTEGPSLLLFSSHRNWQILQKLIQHRKDEVPRDGSHDQLSEFGQIQSLVLIDRWVLRNHSSD